MSLKDAIQLGVEKSPALSTSRAELQLRGLEFDNSFSIFLPSLDLSATHGLRGSRPSIYSNSLNSDLTLQLTETIYDNGASVTKYHSARLQKEIAELGYKNQRDKLVLDIAHEYMRFSLAKSLGQVQEQQFSIINKQYQSIFKQYQHGTKTRRDYLRFKTELWRSEIELQTSRITIEKSRIEIIRLMGLQLNDAETLEFIPVAIELNSVTAVPAKAPELAEHYLYQITNLQKKIMENDVYLVRRQYWPELFLTAGATYHTGDYWDNNWTTTENEMTSWNALLTLKFNLWDWGIRRRNVSIAEARKIQSENSVTSDLNTFLVDNQKLMLELKQSSKNFSLARELLDLETKNYEFIDSEYRNGKVSYLDIIVGLRDLLSAKVQMYTSYFDLRGQLLKYRYHEGKLYESFAEN